MKKLLFILCLTVLPVQAFEDYLISTDGRLTDIKIEKDGIITVSTLVTLMNEKNTLIVRALGEGNTSFSVLKDGSRICVFNVSVTKDKTLISGVDGFEILKIDEPPKFYEYELDFPPVSEGDK